MTGIAGSAQVADRATWTRLADVGGRPLDLLDARIGQRHYAPHVHAEFAVGVCTEGVEVIRYRGERHVAAPGSVVILEPGEPHTGGPAGPEGFAYRVMYPHEAWLPWSSGGRAHFPDPVIGDAELAGRLRAAHIALSRGGDLLEAESRLSWLLTTLVRRHAAPAPPPDRDVRDAGRVARLVVERLEDQMRDPPALTELAADLGLSRYQVLRAFRDATGMPPYAWLAQRRVARARTLLEAGGRPAEVAASVGFADQAHMTRWFRRVLGVTPAAYRNSVQDRVPCRT